MDTTVATYNPERLHLALAMLAGRCNYARNLDGVGFSKFDADFGHALAGADPTTWTPKQTVAAYKLATKYRRQLAEMGLPIESIEAPPEELAQVVERQKVAAKRKVVRYDGSQFIVSFPYDPTLVDAIKKIHGARFTRNPTPSWLVSATEASMSLLARFCERHEVEIDESAAVLSKTAGADVTDLRICTVHPSDEDALALSFPYDYELATEARRFGTWNASTRTWRVPIMRDETVAEFLAFCAAWSVRVDGGAQARIEDVMARRLASLEASRAAEGDPLPIEGLARTPRPFQWAGIRYALEKKRTFIADEMGLGKTIQGIVTLVGSDAFPAVVVCPASLKLNWQREFRLTAPHVRVEVVDGTAARRFTGIFGRPDVLIINYDILSHHVAALEGLALRAVVMDEAHYIKNGKALRSKAVETLCKGVEYILTLTGTPVLNRPNELIFPLKVMRRLDDLGGFRFFTTRYCGGQQGRYGFDSSGSANLGELNDALRACCYIRRLKKDVLKELPPKVRTPIVIPIDNRREYEQTEADFVTWVRDRAAKQQKFLAALDERVQAQRAEWRNAGLSDEEIDTEAREYRRVALRDHQDSAEERALRAETLVRMGVLEQCAVKGKLAGATAWIRDFLESGEKLVVFCTHTEPLKVLAKAFDAPTITGEDDAAARQAAVDKFQTDPTCKVILCNLQAGGVGITLTAASNVAFIETGWTPAVHDQAEDRCHRIGQRDTVTAWYLLAEKTVDEYKAAKLDEKRAVVDAATEGGKVELVSVFGDVLAMLSGRHAEAA